MAANTANIVLDNTLFYIKNRYIVIFRENSVGNHWKFLNDTLLMITHNRNFSSLEI